MLKIPSLNTFYQIIVRNLKVVAGYTEDPSLEFLIKACRLRPYDYYFNNVKKKVLLHRKWFDDYGNCFNLKDKQPEIIFGDVDLIDKTIVGCDFYEGLSIIKTRKMSKQCIFLDCQLLGQQIFLIGFLGLDNYLRTFCIIGDDIKKISSLYLGHELIKMLYENLQNPFKELKIKKLHLPPGCNSATGWISILPANAEFKALVKRNYEQLETIIG